MALKPLNSVGGFSVGEVPANVILANADITANKGTFQGNVAVSNAIPQWGVLTDNLYYSNGVPWDFQQAAGSNGELQFNMGDDFAASPNLTFDNTLQLFTVTGNANITGTLTVGSITTSSLANGNSNVAIPVANSNVNISVAGNANVLVVTGTGANVNGYLDVSGNAIAANLNLDNGYIESLGTSGISIVPANTTAGITLFGNTVPNSNAAINLGSTSKVWANVYANNAIISANLDSGNANLGNLAVANYVNVANQLNVIDGIFAGNLQINVAANISNLAVANFVTSNLTPTTDDQYSLGTTSKRWKDINIAGNANIAVANVSGNLSAGNTNFGNLLSGNFANFANDIQVIGNIANANNISATNGIFANNANITANLTSGNANLGNLATANYLNVAQNVDINGSLDATNANFVGNIAISNSNPAYGILTDNLYYANGVPWDLQEAAGSNTQVQFNNNNDFGASANFTFNTATDTLTVTGNANVTNTVNTPNINSGTSNLTLTSNGYNVTFDASNGNVNFPGNVTATTFYGNVNGNFTTTAANKTILFSDATVIAGSNAFTFDKMSNVVTMSGNVELGLSGQNQLVNLSNTALEIRGGWDANTSSGVNIVAGDYDNNTSWGKLAILGNVSGNAVGYSEANAFVFTNPGASLGNVVRVDILNQNATSTTTGVIQANGGIGVTGNGHFGGDLVVTGNIANANNISVTNTLNAVTGNFSGNINSLNANLGNLAQANFVNVASNLISNNLTVNLELVGNTANFSGNVIVPNLTVNTTLSGNIANFSGNLTSLNANLGNLATANFVNVASNLQTVNANVTGTLIVANANVTGTTITDVLTVNTSIGGNTANFSGNVVLPNLTINLELQGNTANFDGSVTIDGNLNVANINASALINGNSNIRVFANGNVTVSSNGAANVVTVTDNLLVVAGDIQSSTGNILANGNVTANGYLVGGNAVVTGEANVGSVLTSNITSAGNLTLYAGGTNENINLVPTGTGAVDVSGKKIIQLADPVNPTDAATKEYVDAMAGEGLDIHTPVRLESPTALNGTYAQGGTTQTTTDISGGKTITFSANHGLSVNDGIVWTNSFNGIVGGEAYWVFSVPALNQITVKDGYYGPEVTTLTNGTGLSQASRANPGVGATLTNAGANAALQIDGIATANNDRILVYTQSNAYENGVYVVSDTGNATAAWVLTRATDFDKYLPDSPNGLSKGSYVFVTSGLTGAGESYVMTLPIGEVIIGTDNITFTQFSAAGSYTAGNGINITGTTISANTDGVTTAIVAGNIVVKASANLTTPNLGDATFSSLSWNTLSNGNVTANNLSIGNIANITLDLTVGGNIQANGTISSNSNVSGLNLTTSGNVHASGEVLAANVTANSTVFAANANVSGTTITNALTVNNALSGNTANFSGNLTSLNANLGNLATANYVNIASNLQTVNANVTGTLTVANANIGGNITVNNLTVNLELQANTANFDGNVVMDSWLSVANTANVGNLRTDNLLYANGQPWDFQLPAGSNTQVQYNDGAGSFGASANFTFDYATNVLTVTGNANVTNTINGNVGSFTGNMTVNNLLSNGLANVAQLNVTGNVTSDLLPNANLTHDLGNSTLRWDNVYAGNIDASGTLTIGGNTSVTANVTANNITANTSVDVGNTSIYWGTVTTTSITANQTLSTVSITGVTGVEWIVKGVDSSGAKYSMAMVTAVTDGANADYAQFGGVNLGSTTGTLAVNVVGSNIELQVTPASTNSTVWTTQYRTI